MEFGSINGSQSIHHRVIPGRRAILSRLMFDVIFFRAARAFPPLYVYTRPCLTIHFSLSSYASIIDVGGGGGAGIRFSRVVLSIGDDAVIM